MRLLLPDGPRQNNPRYIIFPCLKRIVSRVGYIFVKANIIKSVCKALAVSRIYDA